MNKWAFVGAFMAGYLVQMWFLDREEKRLLERLRGLFDPAQFGGREDLELETSLAFMTATSDIKNGVFPLVEKLLLLFSAVGGFIIVERLLPEIPRADRPWWFHVLSAAGAMAFGLTANWLLHRYQMQQATKKFLAKFAEQGITPLNAPRPPAPR